MTTVNECKHAEEVMEKAREAAEQANTAKSTFLAAASHDLRPPLQTISFLTIKILNKMYKI
jgi:signal transduction histidine kinase